ncbi:MAG: GDP-mannose 4,6-dehydratase [Bryobacteraceae bacterium]|nr:GDP-mannose 4,6-dehydratase [Bryobacteraceae bacterium]
MTFSLPPSARRFLVTGGAGFIGSHVVDRLLESGAERVVVVDDFNDYYDPRTKWENIAGHIAHPAYRVVVGDIRDAGRLERIAREESFDCVVHLAARAGVRPSLSESRLYQEVNIAGTLNLLELARDHGWKHFVFASSSSVYGPVATPPFREDAPLMPISPYAATKAAGELMVHTFSHLYGLRAVCLRFFTVYGPRQRPDLAIHKFARSIVARRPIPVYGDGSSERDYTYIDDILQGIAGAIRYSVEGPAPFEVVNLGESQCITLERLIKLLESAIGERAIIDRRPAQAGDLPLTHADIAKARRLFDYQPSMPIEAGVRRFVEWMRTSAVPAAALRRTA